jgi:hypothetical protein
LRPGQKVRLHSVDYFPEQGYYDSRITRVTRPVNYPGEYTIDVSAVRVVGSLTRLQTSLAAATTKVNNLSNAVQTVVQTVSNAVTLTGNQRVQGVKNFVDGIRVNGSPVIEYDPVINTWLFRGNILAEGGMAAFSNIKGFTPSTITDAVLIDNRTIKRGADGLMYVDLNEVGGGGSGGGSVDPSQLEAYLKPYAKTADVASTYATIASLSAVTSRLNDFLAGSDTDAIINKWSELETFLAGLTETDNLATILSGKANKATTLAGYGITDAYTKSHIDSNFVTIGTKQRITGEKDFVGGFKINGGLVEYNATLKAWVFNGDLLVTGGMAAFSNISGFKPSTITEAVLIDNKTIKLNADGLLYAVPQGAGGINEDQLADYLTTNGYATQSWVTGKGYFLASNFTKANIKSTLGISDWALASAKPTYTASEVGALGVNDTAANANKLDGVEISKMFKYYGFNTDLSIFESGNHQTTTHYINSTDTTITNAPAYYGTAVNFGARVGNFQLFASNTHKLYFRQRWTSDWGAWKQIAFTSDIPTKLSQLTDDMVSGKYLSLAGGTISQSGYWSTKFKSTGQASSAIAFEVANGNVGYLMYADGSKWQVTAQNWSATHILLHSGNYSDYALPITGGKTITGDFSIDVGKRILVDGNNLVGTRVFGEDTQNPRVILSNIKKGTVLISNDDIKSYRSGKEYTILDSGNYSNYALPKDGTAVAATTLKTSTGFLYTRTYDSNRIVNIGADATAEGYSTYIDGMFIRFRYGSAYTTAMEITSNGNVAIGGTSASEKLHVYGNILATGGVTATNSSDERLKRNLRKFNASEVLMSLGGIYEYEYIDSEVQKNHIYEGTHYGLIYQHVKGTTLDVMCHEREDGMGALNYIHPKFISLIAGATMENISEVEKLKRKIRTLEAKVKQLEQRA